MAVPVYGRPSRCYREVRQRLACPEPACGHTEFVRAWSYDDGQWFWTCRSCGARFGSRAALAVAEEAPVTTHHDLDPEDV